MRLFCTNKKGSSTVKTSCFSNYQLPSDLFIFGVTATLCQVAAIRFAFLACGRAQKQPAHTTAVFRATGAAPYPLCATQKQIIDHQYAASSWGATVWLRKRAEWVLCEGARC